MLRRVAPSLLVVILASHCFCILGCMAAIRQKAVAPPADSPNAATIRELIEKLASPLPHDPVVFDAAERLEAFGAEAFPYLLDSLDDQRPSVPFRRVLPGTVGDACYVLISRQLYALPPYYPGSFFRSGAGGSLHERPVFSKNLLTPANLSGWLAARQGRTLPELQLEA